jgi:hypothetical protein
MNNNMDINNMMKMINYNVINNQDMKKQYNKFLNIDYVIETEIVNICILNLYNKNSHINNIKKFISTINELTTITKKKCIAIYMTKNDISQDSKNVFISENIKLNNHFIHIWHNENNVLLKMLTDTLYQNKIYFYDQDSCIMNSD